MARGLEGPDIAAVSADTIAFAYLVELDFVDTPVRLWSGDGTLSYDGKSWSGAGAIGSISSAEESHGLIAKDVTLSLVGQGTGIYSAAMADSRQMQGRFADIYAAWMSSDFTTVTYAYHLQRLIMDTMTVQDVMEVSDGGGIRISINCVDELVDMARPSSVYYSDASQRATHPGDTFFRFIATLPGKDILWAQKAASRNITGGGTGGDRDYYRDQGADADTGG